jgi:hypothetical protein
MAHDAAHGQVSNQDRMSPIQRALSFLRGAGPLLGILVAACGDPRPAAVPPDEPPPTAAERAAATELPAYEALRDSVVDRPGQTLVERRLIVQDTAEDEAVEALLRAEFAAIMASGPYAYREHPTHVYIRVYDSEVRSRRPARWRAMLRFGPGADEPAIQMENATLERQLER